MVVYEELVNLECPNALISGSSSSSAAWLEAERAYEDGMAAMADEDDEEDDDEYSDYDYGYDDEENESNDYKGEKKRGGGKGDEEGRRGSKKGGNGRAHVPSSRDGERSAGDSGSGGASTSASASGSALEGAVDTLRKMSTALVAGRWLDVVELGRQGVGMLWQEMAGPGPGPGLGQGVGPGVEQGMEMSIMRGLGSMMARWQRWVGSSVVWFRMIVLELVGMFGDAQQRLQGVGRMNKRRNGNEPKIHSLTPSHTLLFRPRSHPISHHPIPSL